MNALRTVAQICNLLYRRSSTCGPGFVFGQVAECNSTIREIENLRCFVSLFALLAFSPTGCLFAQSDVTNATTVRFLAVDIVVDSDAKPLAAYQLEFSVTNGAAKIVGIEGGKHPAFREPPHYDPKAMQQARVVIAAFSSEPQNNLPSGKTRVATIHLQIRGGIEPQFLLSPHVAADVGGNKLTISASFERRETQ
jgi:hypothetical protein